MHIIYILKNGTEVRDNLNSMVCPYESGSSSSSPSSVKKRSKINQTIPH